MPLISCKNIEKIYYDGTYTTTKALNGVSFTIESGEFVAIMGPSGSGKSTLLHILGFLDRHTSGTYRFDGKTINDFKEPELAHLRNKKMGFVFQAFHLLARTTLLENVMLPLMYSDVPHSEWKEKALRAIEIVGLAHREKHDPSQLSGGERQRVAIARALVNSPDIIFADEPTGNLDTHAGSQIMMALTRLNKEEGHTVVVITHEHETAEHADRIIFIRDGKLESDTRPKTKVEYPLNGWGKESEKRKS